MNLVCRHKFAVTVLSLALLDAQRGVSARHVADRKYYDLLGVPLTASDAQLRKAYHKLALQWHPDKQSQKSAEDKKLAEEKFKEISLAYDTLSDPAKRKLYDQVGEEGMKRGDRGRGFQTGGFDPFKIFEQVFKGFGGGASFSFNMNMGGNFGGHEGLFADSPDDVETLTDQNKLQELITESTSEIETSSKQFVVVLCTENNGDCKKLKSGIIKMSKSHKQAVAFYALDCIKRPMLCRHVEPDVKRYPCIVYYGYSRRLPYGVDKEGSAPPPLEEKITLHSIRTWLARITPDSVINLNSMDDKNRFLDIDQHKLKVVFLTEKASVSPRLKTLSMDLSEDLLLAAVSKKTSPEVFKSFVAGHNSPDKFPCLYNVQSGEFAFKAGDDLKEYFATSIEAFKSQVPGNLLQLEELTLDSYESGSSCTPTDHKYCLLAIFSNVEAFQKEKRNQVFLNVSREFQKEKSNPLRVHYILRDRTRSADGNALLAKLNPLLTEAGLATEESGGVILWRPKWRRFEKLDCQACAYADVLAFVRSSLMTVALDGQDGLSQMHTEL